MLRLRYTPLGQYQGPYQAQITQIAQNFPACFTSSSILPMLDQAIASGNALNQQLLSNATAVTFGGFKPSDVRNAIQKAQDLRNRYAAEDPNTQYCNSDSPGDSPDGYPYNQHYRTLQAVTGIYQFAAGVVGGNATNTAAVDQLKQDLNPLNALPPLVPGLGSGWMQWLVVGAVAVAVYMSMKKSTVVVVQPQE